MGEMSTVDVLVAARALIEDESQWRQGGDRGPSGQRCAVAAVADVDADNFEEALQALREAIGGAPLFSSFNDSHTHAEVIAAFDVAIANERAKVAV